MAERAAPLMLDVLEEHFEELDFLWDQREHVIFAPDWTMRGLAQLDDRIEAHLDGLSVGGVHAAKIARAQLSSEDSAATAAALALLSMDVAPIAAEVVDATVAGIALTRERIRIALRHSDPRLVSDRLYELSVGADVGLRALATDVLAFHRLRPPPDVERLLDVADPVVLRLGYGAAGRFGTMSPADLDKALVSNDTALRGIALEAAARCGLPNLVEVCRSAARRRGAGEAVAFLGVVGNVDDVATLEGALRDSALARFALAGMGSLGCPSAVPRIIEAMREPALADAAAGAFARITGVDAITKEPPSGTAANPVDADEQTEDEPPPDPVRAKTMWDTVSAKFTPSRRWQGGIDVTDMSFGVAEHVVSLEVRRDLYLRARATGGGVPDTELERRIRRTTLRAS